MDAKRAFGKKVRLIRKKRGLSQEELADLADLHRTYIGAVERGERNISLENIVSIACALGCTVSSLIEEVDKESKADQKKERGSS